jgi:hypothetical protein
MVLVKAEPEWKALHRIADRQVPAVAAALHRLFDDLKNQIPVGQLSDFIAAGRLDKILETVKLDLPDMTALRDTIRQVVDQSAAYGVKVLEPRFDLVNPEAVGVIGSDRWVETYGNQLVQGVNAETQKAINEIVRTGILTGIPPRQQAQQIRGMVGLTRRDGKAVANYFDGLLEAGLTEGDARGLADKYHSRLLRRRAETIARTETMRAANMGQQLAWEKASDAGLIPGTQKIWIVTDDDRTCARCLTLDDAVVDLGQPFVEGNKEDRPDVDPPPPKPVKPKVPKRMQKAADGAIAEWVHGFGRRRLNDAVRSRPIGTTATLFHAVLNAAPANSGQTLYETGDIVLYRSIRVPISMKSEHAYATATLVPGTVWDAPLSSWTDDRWTSEEMTPRRSGAALIVRYRTVGATHAVPLPGDEWLSGGRFKTVSSIETDIDEWTVTVEQQVPVEKDVRFRWLFDDWNPEALFRVFPSFHESGQVVFAKQRVTTLTPPLHPRCRCAMGLVETTPIE